MVGTIWIWVILPLITHLVESGSTTVNWVDISELTQVFSGTVTIANQEVSITLDTPFEYNGTDNLIVSVNETSNVNNLPMILVAMIFIVLQSTGS